MTTEQNEQKDGSKGSLFYRIAEWFPEPFVLCMLLTVIAVAAAVVVLERNRLHRASKADGPTTDTGGAEGNPAGGEGKPEVAAEESTTLESTSRTLCRVLVEGWFAGFTDARFLSFAFQIGLIIVTGGALARTPIANVFVNALASFAAWGGRTWWAVLVVGYVAVTTGVLNWGLSLVLSGLLARQVIAKRGKPLPAVVAASYLGLLVWHGGLSGSIPLEANRDAGAILGGTIPIEETLNSRVNWFATLGAVGFLPVVLALVCSKWPGEEAESPSLVHNKGIETDPAEGDRVWEICLTWLVTLSAISALVLISLEQGWKGLGLGFVTTTFLCLGIVFSLGRPRHYASIFAESAGDVAPILLQFPFYGGILGLLRMDNGTLTREMALQMGQAVQALVGALGGAEDTAFLVFTFVSACVTNLFVPSGGGQWAVQAPVIFQMAEIQQVSVKPARIAMAIAYGDQTTNMMQPFWLLPLLAINEMHAKDVLTYTWPCMVVAGSWFLGCLLLL